MTALTLWEFSLLHYAKPAIADCCLQLQDTYGANVNVILWSAWLEQRNIALSDAILNQAITRITPWNTSYTQALRQLRRQMKQEFSCDLPTISPVREAIKQAELLAEQQEQQWLEELAANLTPESAQLELGSNLQLYFSKLSTPSVLALRTGKLFF